MTPRKIALARAFPILVGIVLCGGIIVFLALSTMRGIEQSQAVAARFEGLAKVCEGAASSGTERPQVGEAGEVRGVAFRLVEGEWVYDATTLAPERRAAQPEEAQVVLCLGPAKPLVTAACGGAEDGLVPTRIYGEALTVRLLAAEDGALLAEDVLQSAPEVGCREDEGAVVRVGEAGIREWVAGELEIGD